MKIDKYPIPKTCDYCGSKVIFTSNAEIYGREYGNGKCYKCTKCDAYVGVHTNSRIPLGRLANKELRELKKKAHSIFDPMWQRGKGHGREKRSMLYRWLANELSIPISECHFGWFDKDMLERAIKLLEQKNKRKEGRPDEQEQ